jgi:peroxiredoxin
MSMPIVNPSTFHLCSDSLQRYLDGVMGLGLEEVDGQLCDVIEVSFMKGQRSWYLWLSREDHLPRKLRKVIRVAFDITMQATWSEIVVNGEMPTERFIWTPPEGWRQWQTPCSEDFLLKQGTSAPDFDLLAADGSRIKLSDYREKIVWFYIWRAGCPPCREGMRHIQEVHEKYRDNGLVVLGVNWADDKAIALEFMRENGATFPTVLDSSEAATQTGFRDYRANGVPVNYSIDRDGKVVDAWYGNERGHKRALAAIEKAGLSGPSDRR